MINTNENGVGLVEGLLVVVTILLLGFGGYYVYTQNKDSSSSATVAETTETDSTTSEEVACSASFDEAKISDGTKYDLADGKVFFLLNEGAQDNNPDSGIYLYSAIVTTDDLCKDGAYVEETTNSWHFTTNKFYVSPEKSKIAIISTLGEGVILKVYDTSGLALNSYSPFGEIASQRDKENLASGGGGLFFDSWLDEDTVVFNFGPPDNASDTGQTIQYSVNVDNQLVEQL